jgi:phenol/toluene 2-monooxygenase (NADH) P0/A0
VVVKPLKHYVHITNKKRAGFVEFNYSINDPSLFLEMILPTDAFEDFCEKNSVIFLSPEEVMAVERQQEKWRDGDNKGISLIHNNSQA